MTAFAQLSPTPQTHWRLHLHAAIVHLTHHLVIAGGEETLSHFGFLQAYCNELQEYLPMAGTVGALTTVVDRAIAEWEATLPVDSHLWPLRRLTAAGLCETGLRALLWSGLVELDARFSAVFALLHAQPDEPRLTVGLLSDLLTTINPAEESSGWQIAHTLYQQGLVTIEHGSRPRAARAIHVVELIWDLCSGEAITLPPGFQYTAADEATPLSALHAHLPETLLMRLQRTPQLLSSGVIDGLILRGMRGSGRRRMMSAIARELGLGMLVATPADPQQLPATLRQLGPLATLLAVLPVLELEMGPGDQVTLPPLTEYRGPFGILLGQEGTIDGEAIQRAVTLAAPTPQVAGRRAQWMQSFGYELAASTNGHGAVIDEASRRFHLTYGVIAQAGQLAKRYAALDGRDHVALADIHAACRSLNQQSFAALATRLDAEGNWEQLIVSPTVQSELQNLVMRCRQREAVLAQLGPGFGHITRGVRALFGGPSGTGKTLAARILAAELGLDLYRIDLAAVVSKYIGETERNLSRLFARAEEQDIILLLDEGDSLLTGRTEVRNANDRYANMETNYLLQRLEHYEGIFLVTTNAAGRIDSAFQRRMDAIIEFATPNAAQRYAIWQLHLPRAHALSEKFLRNVATRCDLSGGQIRNATLHAAVLAVEHATPLSNAFLAEGVAREYRKLGAGSPLPEETTCS